MEKYYKFASCAVKTYSEVPFETAGVCSEFECGECKPCHTIEVSYSDVIPEVPTDAVKRDVTSLWYEGEKRYVFSHYTAAENLTFHHAVGTKDRTHLTFSRYYEGKIGAFRILETAGLFEILSGFEMSVLHSSYITFGGHAILFCGESGIGKSTQAYLWEKYKGAFIVNGDRTLIDTKDMSANGICYSGTSGICHNVTSPLCAVVILGQSPKNAVRRAGATEAFKTLLCQSAYYPYDAKSASAATETAAKIASSVAVYKFDCTPDESAVSVLFQRLKEDRLI